MSDRPILFSAPMVRALLDGTKTKTRRILKPLPRRTIFFDPQTAGLHQFQEPFCAVGDRLWVREAHAIVPASAYRMSEGVVQTINPVDRDEAAVYRLGWERSAPHWRPSIHMPRWASRLTLTVTSVRIERLQDISEADAIAEGVECDTDGWRDYLMPHTQCCVCAIESYRTLWDHIDGPGSWEQNPWIVAVSFDVHHCNIDQMEARAA